MLNYLGQLRLYSLVDLSVLLVAINATAAEFIGAIFLHVGYLACLEAKHKHSYRKGVPKYLWIVLTFIGLLFYGHIEGIFFVICGYIYILKTQKSLALFSPIMRGFQYFFLVAGIVGYDNKLTWIALILITVRNLCGDLRDIVKDKEENLKTIPIAMGLNRNVKYIHLAVMLITTFVWFQYTNLPLWIIIPVFLIQIFTYNLTPR